ncbi:MAG TPA: tetraacyldisaccharide 4'-kinase, partial [Cytophagales bacterium]|nr:tetraacyldisaccharide 4'-kinase [Cytophagales bacterium]
ATEHDNASTLGDEPFQFYQKFKNKVEIFVCENRVEGIRTALQLKPGIQVFLLDDAFQHRRVKPMLSILLTEFSKPFFNDFILPRGRLRESRYGCKRADVIMVTKCISVTNEVEQKYQAEIHSYSSIKPIFFTKINYSEPISFAEGEIKRDIVLVSGIANSVMLKEHVTANYNLVLHFNFGDHHRYSSKDIEQIQIASIENYASIITTEKDYAKLIHMDIDKKLWFYLPIQSSFINSGSEFDRYVYEKIENHLSK